MVDDLDNLGHLGHFFGVSSGSHLQLELNYLDVTQISLVLYHYSVKPACCLKLF